MKYLTSFDVKWNSHTFAQRTFRICAANISQRSYFTCPKGKFRWKKHLLSQVLFVAPPTGLEPVTPWLTVRCSTDWAMEEYVLVRFPLLGIVNSHVRGALQMKKWVRLCWHRPIFPARRQASIFGSAQLNFCVRNGNRWTLCANDTNFSYSSLCSHRPIFPARRQASIFGSAQLNFCVRNGNRWTLCANDTNFLVHLQGFEPGTHWLRVSCSTNWAKGAFLFQVLSLRSPKCSLKTE